MVCIVGDLWSQKWNNFLQSFSEVNPPPGWFQVQPSSAPRGSLIIKPLHIELLTDFILTDGTSDYILHVLLSICNWFNLFLLINDILKADLQTTVTKVKPPQGASFKVKLSYRGSFKWKRLRRVGFKIEMLSNGGFQVKPSWDGVKSGTLARGGFKCEKERFQKWNFHIVVSNVKLHQNETPLYLFQQKHPGCCRKTHLKTDSWDPHTYYCCLILLPRPSLSGIKEYFHTAITVVFLTTQSFFLGSD